MPSQHSLYIDSLRKSKGGCEVLKEKGRLNKVFGTGTDELMEKANIEGTPRERVKKYSKKNNRGRVLKNQPEGAIELGKDNVQTGFGLEIPDWIRCKPETYKVIAKIAAMEMAGLSRLDIAEQLSISNQYVYQLMDSYPDEFATAQKTIIQHAAVQLGVNLFAFRAALLDIVPEAIDRLGRMIKSDKVGERVRLEAIKTVLRFSGISMAQGTPLEQQVKLELVNFIKSAVKDLSDGSSVIEIPTIHAEVVG